MMQKVMSFVNVIVNFFPVMVHISSRIDLGKCCLFAGGLKLIYIILIFNVPYCCLSEI